MIGPTSESAWPIYTPDPVNRECRLNDSLTSWWLALPGLTGGQTFYDICGLRHGTLNVSGSSGWHSSTRPGALAQAMNLDGFTTYVDTPSQAQMPITGFTMSAWGFNTTSTQGTILGQINSSPSNAAFYFRIYGAGGGSGYTSGGSFVGASTPITPSTVAWHHFTAVFIPSIGLFRNYVDGVVNGSTTIGSSPPDAESSSCRIGRLGQFNGQFWPGLLDDIAIRRRALTDSEVWSLYDDSRSGHPDTLNRDVPLYALPPATQTQYAASANYLL